MKRKTQGDRVYWDGLQLIASNVEFIVSDGPQPWMQGDGLLGSPTARTAPRPRSMLAAALAGDVNDPFGSFDIFVSSLRTPSGKLHDAILSLLPGADQLGDSRQERIDALTARLTELEPYRWLLGRDYVKALKAIKRAGRKGGKFASDVVEFELLSLLIYPLSMYQLSQERPEAMKLPTRVELDDAFKAARSLEKFFANHGGLYISGNADAMAVHRLHDIADSLLAMRRAHYRAPQDKKLAEKTLYIDSLIVGFHRAFGGCSVPALIGLAQIVDYQPESSNLYARVRMITQKGVAKHP